MPETLLSPSNILLYGRVVDDLAVKHEGPNAGNKQEEEIHRPFVEVRKSANRLLQDQLQSPEAKLARIYGFSYEGRYYDLAKPALFLVHGDGGDARPAEADRVGEARPEDPFADDMKVWSYDKGDFSMRLDVETGPLDHILLEFELQTDRLRSYYSGADVRMRGADVRMRGADLRARGRGSSD